MKKDRLEELTVSDYQDLVDEWIKTLGVRYFSELTNLGILMEEVGEVTRIMTRTYGDQSFKPEIDGCWNFADGKLTIDLGKALELKTPGGAIRFEGKNLPKRVLVVCGEDGEYRAFHNRCTHLGHRRLDPVPGTDTVQCCSVNKSTYDSGGNKIFGPTPHPITKYPVKKDHEKLIVSIS